jgi:hypothetical protein
MRPPLASRVHGFPSNGLWLALFISTTPEIARGCPNPQRPRRRIAQGRAHGESASLTSFHGFGLNVAIARAIAEEKYATPTPIQVQTIPVVMSRRDVRRA